MRIAQRGLFVALITVSTSENPLPEAAVPPLFAVVVLWLEEDLITSRLADEGNVALEEGDDEVTPVDFFKSFMRFFSISLEVKCEGVTEECFNASMLLLLVLLEVAFVAAVVVVAVTVVF